MHSSTHALQWKVNKKQLPRSVAGKCAVPEDFTQLNNCALGFLVLSDVIEAYLEVGAVEARGQSARGDLVSGGP